MTDKPEEFLGFVSTDNVIRMKEPVVAPNRIWFAWYITEGQRKPLFGRSRVAAGGWVLYFYRWQVRRRPYMAPYWIWKRRDGFVDSFFGKGPRVFTKAID